MNLRYVIIINLLNMAFPCYDEEISWADLEKVNDRSKMTYTILVWTYILAMLIGAYIVFIHYKRLNKPLFVRIIWLLTMVNAPFVIAFDILVLKDKW